MDLSDLNRTPDFAAMEKITEACMRDVGARMNDWIDGKPIWSYKRIIKEWGHNFAGRPGYSLIHYSSSDFQNRTALSMARHWFVAAFGFAIPCAELIEALRKLQPVLEVGAGTGYMTAMARAQGVDIVGTDLGHGGHGFEVGARDPRQIRIGATAAVQSPKWRKRTVFSSWPTKGGWFENAVKAMQRDRHITVISDESCCASTAAWAYMEKRFGIVDEIPLPSWPNMDDRCIIYRKVS